MPSGNLNETRCASAALGAAVPPSVADRLMRLHPAISRCGHPAGARLFAEDETIDRLYGLAAGWALKTKWLIDGRRQILDFALPGDVLGSVGAHRMSYGVEMLTAGDVVLVPRGLFAAVACANPEIALEVCRQREAAEQRAYDHIASIGCRSARIRVCRLLVEFIARQPQPPGTIGELRRRLPLRQVHIADALGLRIETVCRVLGQLARSGIAVLRSGWLTVADPEALRAEAERDEPAAPTGASSWAPRGPLIESPPSLDAAARGRPGTGAARGGMDLGEKGLRQP